MIWYKKLYISESLQHKKRRVIWKIRHNVLQPGIFIIILSNNERNNFVIIPSMELLQKNYPNKENMVILGIADGKEEALMLLENMVNDALDSGLSIDNIKEYFQPLGGRK